MVFASLSFLYVFLPLTLLLYYCLPGLAWKNGVLILTSLLFYAWGEPVWTILLLLSTLADYIHGLIIARYPKRWPAKAALFSSLLVNLGLLASFKYSAFFADFLNGLFGLSLSLPVFVLPIGISFYTFQSISYIVDVYRRELPAQENFWKFLLFISLFHQLVAGPIVRYRDIAKAIEFREFRLKIFSSGVSRFALGLAKKVVLANPLGASATVLLGSDLDSLPLLGAWWGMLLFALQIYFDFSGYSDMAIGLGRMFGFEYRENFRHPYVSRSATEFWRRWHISLGSFFRDYVYIPMGGNRKRQALNLFVVWFLTGLWHGASWNFVLWGLYYGILIGIERLLGVGRRLRAHAHSPLGPPRPLAVLASCLYMFVVSLLGWSLFYFTDLAELGRFLGVMFGFAAESVLSPRVLLEIRGTVILVLVSCIASLPLFPWVWRRLVRAGWSRTLFQSLGKFADFALLALSTVFLVGASYNPFLYFRF